MTSEETRDLSGNPDGSRTSTGDVQRMEAREEWGEEEEELVLCRQLGE